MLDDRAVSRAEPPEDNGEGLGATDQAAASGRAILDG